jgi:hypothetical protein
MATAHDLHGHCRRRLVGLSGAARNVAALAKPGEAFTLVKCGGRDSSSRGVDDLIIRGTARSDALFAMI